MIIFVWSALRCVKYHETCRPAEGEIADKDIVRKCITSAELTSRFGFLFVQANGLLKINSPHTLGIPGHN